MSGNSEPAQIRYLGPYQFRGQWRCQLVSGTRRTWMTPEKTQERAIAVAERVVAASVAQQPMTVRKALDAYEEYKLSVKANKPGSVTTTIHRLSRFFSEPGLALYQLTPQRCNGYYQKLVATQKPATHRNTLAEADGAAGSRPTAGACASHRPRQPVRQRRISGSPADVWPGGQHESKRKLLGQRRRRELLRDPENRAVPPLPLCYARPSTPSDLRVHRSLLQSRETPLLSRLQEPSRVRIPAHRRAHPLVTRCPRKRSRSTCCGDPMKWLTDWYCATCIKRYLTACT